MKHLAIKIQLSILCMAFSIGCSPSFSGEIELSNRVNLMISRTKSKARQMEHTGVDDYIDLDDRRDDMFDDNNSGCGSVDIGTLETNNRPTFGRTQMETIVIGDVINANNRC